MNMVGKLDGVVWYNEHLYRARYGMKSISYTLPINIQTKSYDKNGPQPPAGQRGDVRRYWGVTL